jgi:hypothetical protein
LRQIAAAMTMSAGLGACPKVDRPEDTDAHQAFIGVPIALNAPPSIYCWPKLAYRVYPDFGRLTVDNRRQGK